jgi:NADH-quinone oxidoreductase subunit H
VYAERKIAAFVQDRQGPTETGYYGLLQTLADVVKLLQKEDIVPLLSSKPLFLAAPFFIFIAVFASFSFVPLSWTYSGASVEVSLFFLLAVLSLDILAILAAGWGSGNKYAFFGAIRAVAQVISYEIPLGLAVLCVVVSSQSLNLQTIIIKQSLFASKPIFLFGISQVDISHIGGFLAWNVAQNPMLCFVFLIFFVASLAEANRTPFDLPEAESELISGFHTEYSGFRWAVFMLAEYGIMLLMSLVAVILFFGGWASPLPNIGSATLGYWTSGNIHAFSGDVWAVFWLLSKTLCLVFVQMWIRWTYPRLRFDQLMVLCWQYLVPSALFFLVLCSIWRLFMK